DFPSLAGTSLDNCLLNSPLELNPTVALPSIYPAPPLHEHVSQQTSKINTSKGDSTSDQQTQPPTKTLPFPCTTISIPLFKLGEGISYYDEATWNDQFGYSFESTNGGQKI